MSKQSIGDKTMLKAIVAVVITYLLAFSAIESKAESAFPVSPEACSAWVDGLIWVHDSVKPDGDVRVLAASFTDSDTWSLSDEDHDRLLMFLEKYNLSSEEQVALIETLSYAAVERYYGLLSVAEIKSVYQLCGQE